MPARCGWVGVGLLCWGLGSLSGAEPVAAVPPAQRLWEQGQRDMDGGRIDQAMACYRHSLRLDPSLACNHLSLAAAYLDRGQDEQAAPHLARYVEVRPDHFVIRAHYAELLLRLERPREARAQFERFVVDAQGRDDLAREHLVHCHSRLVEIAEGEADAYAAHLHRGIGLYLLARQRACLPEPDGELSVEELLFRAAAELTLARKRQPGQARPCWYLHEVWSSLAQANPAAHWLRAAATGADSDLTPAERTRLYFACRALDVSRK
jgi:tetratricopeptide (TPR) repeat protein